MTNIAVEFLRATVRDFTRGFADTLYDVNSDGTRAKTEGLQYRLRTLRVRMLDGTGDVYRQAGDLAKKSAHIPLKLIIIGFLFWHCCHLILTKGN